MGAAFGTPGFRTLENFYASVQWSNPGMALVMHDDLTTVALRGIAGDRAPAYPAVIRLRRQAMSLPAALSRILDHSLGDLGYSIEHVYEVAATLA